MYSSIKFSWNHLSKLIVNPNCSRFQFVYFCWTTPALNSIFFPSCIARDSCLLDYRFYLLDWKEQNKETRNKNKKHIITALFCKKINDFCQLKCQSFIFFQRWFEKSKKKKTVELVFNCWLMVCLNEGRKCLRFSVVKLANWTFLPVNIFCRDLQLIFELKSFQLSSHYSSLNQWPCSIHHQLLFDRYNKVNGWKHLLLTMKINMIFQIALKCSIKFSWAYWKNERLK